MHILVVSATAGEIAPLQEHLQTEFIPLADFHFQKGNLEVSVLITGVGMTATAFCLGQVLARRQFDLVLNAGLAGALNGDLQIGEVVNVVSERWGDFGVEEADGRFIDVHELGLADANQPPFENGMLLNKSGSEFGFLRKCKGLTVNKVHGFSANIEAIRHKYDADVESMEGAAIFYGCLLAKIPFLEIRSISNRVEPRNREAWNLPLAITNLNNVLKEILSLWK